MNYIGVVAAFSAFLAIWFGHVAVRKIEFSAPVLWVPAAVLFSLGLLLEWLALSTRALPASTAFGIVGITFLWDTRELSRQEGRVRNGHAPANPRNPRHAAMLKEAESRATTLDLLKHSPTRVSAEVLPESGARIHADRRGIPY